MAGRIVGPFAVMLGIVLVRRRIALFFDELKADTTRRRPWTPGSMLTVIAIGLFLILWGVGVAVTGDDLVRGN